MDTFKDFKISRQLANAIDDLGFERPTPIQSASFPIIASGKNVVGIAQTGTGKTLAYLLPLLQQYKYSEQMDPRILILVPTRELVDQVVEQIEALTKYITIKILGVYGGSNIRTQKQRVAAHGANILVATPGRLYDLEERYGHQIGVIHANKSQNFRSRTVEEFDQGSTRILVSTDVMARGLDLDRITHVFNFDTPIYAENYMHRIGRTGRAKEKGTSILFYTEKEAEYKEAIEALMDYQIPELPFPEAVNVSTELTPEERPRDPELYHKLKDSGREKGDAFHEKKDKNKKVNLGGGKRKKDLKVKYKKPKTRGDKFANKKKKR
ncbi:UNVERIFIED_CONTAM: hypothetical protein GTU68_061028 [Idotea baltica]|nr:hypothetical protein [Idotea baltica]